MLGAPARGDGIGQLDGVMGSGWVRLRVRVGVMRSGWIRVRVKVRALVLGSGWARVQIVSLEIEFAVSTPCGIL